MATTPTTINITRDLLQIPVLISSKHSTLNGHAFTVYPQNYWLARITPPDNSQRVDSYYRGATRPFQRRYLVVPNGCARYQFDVKDLTYGFAYEFGGDRVNIDRRTPARIYCVYLGLNDFPGTMAEFRIFPTAEAAMECERQRAMSTPVHDPAPAPAVPTPAPSTLMTLPPALFTRMEALYGEMVSRLHAINTLEQHLKEAGYKPALADNSTNVMQTAILDGKEYGETAWIETFLPVVRAEAVRMGEEALARQQARQQAQETAVYVPPAPVPTQTDNPPVTPSSLLDAIADAHAEGGEAVWTPPPVPAPAPAPVNRLTQEADLLTPAPAPAKPARQRRTPTGRTPSRPALQNVPAPARVTRIPRPSNIPAPTDPNCPF